MESIVSMTKLNESTKELPAKWSECDLCLCNPIARPFVLFCLCSSAIPRAPTHDAVDCSSLVAEKGKMKMHSIWDDTVRLCPASFYFGKDKYFHALPAIKPRFSDTKYDIICRTKSTWCRRKNKATRNVSVCGFSIHFQPFVSTNEAYHSIFTGFYSSRSLIQFDILHDVCHADYAANPIAKCRKLYWRMEKQFHLRQNEVIRLHTGNHTGGSFTFSSGFFFFCSRWHIKFGDWQ